MKGQPFKKIAGVLKAIAPTVLTAVGGPAGGLAATIIKRTMGDESMTDDALESAVEMALTTPEGREKVRLAELELKKIEKENDFKFEEIAAQDRQSARQLAQSTTITPQVALSLVFITGYAGVVGALIAGVWNAPMGTEQLVAALIGVLTAGVIKILDFWFGSSAGSKAKTDILGKMSNGSLH